MSRRHELKCWTDPFAAVRSGAKTFEARWNDRDYAVDDVLELREFDPIANAYTGEVEERRVSYVSGEAEEKFGVTKGYVVLGLAASAPALQDAPAADPEELCAWHADAAANARLRAENWRRKPKVNAVGRARQEACAQAAESEAELHERAVKLIRTLIASVRLLANGATANG